MLGCSVHRLRDFILEYYKNTSQNIDDVYQAFVWSLLVEQHSIRVGVLPPGQHAEVYIPPQPRSTKRKGTTSETVEEDTLNGLQPVDDVKTNSFENLVRDFGDRLRIAVNQETICTTITGSHIRVSPSYLTWNLKILLCW